MTATATAAAAAAVATTCRLDDGTLAVKPIKINKGLSVCHLGINGLLIVGGAIFRPLSDVSAPCVRRGR